MYHTLTRLKGFLLRAGQVIVIVVVILSFLNSLGTDGSFGNEDSSGSILAFLGRKVTPVFQPMGITEDNWPASVGLFTGIFAKEAVVGTLDNLYTTMAEQRNETPAEPEEFIFADGIVAAFQAIPQGFRDMGSTLSDPIGTGTAVEDVEAETTTFDMIREKFNGTAGAYAYLLFILIYAPCVAAIAAIYRETSLRWAAFSTLYLTLLAWVVSTLFYRTATFAGAPGESALWTGVALALLAGMFLALKLLSKGSALKA